MSTEVEIKKVGVVGCGLMGHGVAQVATLKGYSTVVCDVTEEFLERGFARIESSLDRLVKKGRMSAEDREAVLGRMTRSTNYEDLRDCDLVIEAIIENLDEKKKLLRQLDGIVDSKAIFASNTSSFPIEEMANETGRLERFVGLHFFNPVQIMKLVEIVRLEGTSDDVLDAIQKFVHSLDKHPVLARDTPGFIVNRLLVPYMAAAFRMFERGDATKEDIDAAMQYGCGYPMGPLTLTDYVGLDTTLFILEGWHERYPDEPQFFPPDLLKQMVAEGRLGRKSGRGFYEWEGDKKR